jgi:Acetyltransferase (GNAT) domain
MDEQSLSVKVVRRDDLMHCGRWREAFVQHRKDWRFYELVEDTIRRGFDYRYFAVADANGVVRAVQPFLIVDQDLLAGAPSAVTKLARAIRRLWPYFMRARTLMVGCAVGEGHLDGADEAAWRVNVRALARALPAHARDLGVRLIVFKEFPAIYRAALQVLSTEGFARIPSMPMVYRDIAFRSFEDYAARSLNKKTRYNLRRKFQEAAAAGPLTMSYVSDATPVVDEIYPLYLQVYERSSLHFEKLTREFLCGLGQRIPDKVRFFLWRKGDRIVAFNLCMVAGDAIYSEYIGLDYAVAFDLHLYFVMVRDVIEWAIGNGYNTYHSSALNYDPKYRLRFLLNPLDLYVRHTSPIANAVLARVLPLLGPTRYDPNLKRFANFQELDGS